MISRKQTLAGLTLALLATTAIPGHASIFGSSKKDEIPGRKLSPAQSALIDKALLREKDTIKIVRERQPIVETYIQNMKPDPVMRQVPESDQHFLGRVQFGKEIGDDQYKAGEKNGQKQGLMSKVKGSVGFLGGVTNSLHLQFAEGGFVRMILIDSTGQFDKQHYNFYYVRNDFLGNVPTAVFDVSPIKKNDAGRFFGRMWVDTRDGNIVRYNGDLAGGEKDYHEFFHFDSWRTNVQPDLWLPNSVYVEESDPKSQTSTLKFKAINYVWGYVLKVPPAAAANTDVTVENATDVSSDANDVSPLGAERQFVQQAEDNVVERLFQAGLLDAPSDFDKTLEALANNILAYNNVAVTRPIRVRTLMTEPLESLSVGNTIILSKSMIDTSAVLSADGSQQTGNLNAMLAFQLAHILTGHKLDTKYAFNDRLLFPDNASFKRIPMHHTDADNQEAAKKTLELLNAKELEGGQQYFGLYLQSLQARIKGLKALNEPMIGDSLIKNDTTNTFWLQALIAKSPKLDPKDLKQQGAVPLASFLRFDPWTDQLITLHTAFEPILSPSDKMPFEVAPVYIKLSFYKAPVNDGPAPGTQPAAPADPNAQPQQGQPAPSQPATPADQQSAPPAPVAPSIQ